MKRIVAMILSMLLMLSCAALGEGVRFEGEGYDSPEAAVEAYISHFNEGDVWGMVSTFAVETAVDHTDPRALAIKYAAFIPSSASQAPRANAYTRALAVGLRANELVSGFYQQMLAYGWPLEDSAFNNNTTSFHSSDREAEIDAFYDGIEASDFANAQGQIEFVRFMTSEEVGVAKVYDGKANQDNIEADRVIYGCDELADRVALVRIAGVDYVQFMTCARYGDRWYNFRPHGYMANFSNVPFWCGGLVPLDALGK